MAELLMRTESMAITEAEIAELDQVIENAIFIHKNNAAMITKLTFDSVTALTAGEARARELAEQGFFKRFKNKLTGKNRKIRAQIDADYIRAQYAAQQTIEKLAEQNLLTFDVVTAVNNKLNSLILEVDEEINYIYKNLVVFFKQTRSEIVQLERRLDVMERNVKLLHWSSTIEYQLFNGTEYEMLPDMEKIVCVANDFFQSTRGEWSTADLMLLKKTLSELGIEIKARIAPKAFYSYLADHPVLIDKLFDGISLEGMKDIEPYEGPLIKGVEKAIKLKQEERYILETVKTQLEEAGVTFTERDLQLSLVHQYLKQTAFMDSGQEADLFDFVVEMLVDLKMVNEAEGFVYDTEVLAEAEGFGYETEVLAEAEDPERIYDVVIFTHGEDKYQLIKELRRVLSLGLKETHDLVSKLPAQVLVKGTKAEADEVVAVAQKHGAAAFSKTEIEQFHTIASPVAGAFFLKDEPSMPVVPFFKKTEEYQPFVSEGQTVAENQTVAFIVTNPFLTSNEFNPRIKPGIKSKILKIVPEHKQEVAEGDLLMVIKEV